MELETYEAPRLVLIGEAEILVQGSSIGDRDCGCGRHFC